MVLRKTVTSTTSWVPTTSRVGNTTVETGNAVKSMKLLAQVTAEYTREELNKDAMLGWTTKAQELIDADKQSQQGGGNGKGNCE